MLEHGSLHYALATGRKVGDGFSRSICMEEGNLAAESDGRMLVHKILHWSLSIIIGRVYRLDFRGIVRFPIPDSHEIFEFPVEQKL